jgi:FtsZ-binding cell division protein ZapB
LELQNLRVEIDDIKQSRTTLKEAVSKVQTEKDDLIEEFATIKESMTSHLDGLISQLEIETQSHSATKEMLSALDNELQKEIKLRKQFQKSLAQLLNCGDCAMSKESILHLNNCCQDVVLVDTFVAVLGDQSQPDYLSKCLLGELLERGCRLDEVRETLKGLFDDCRSLLSGGVGKGIEIETIFPILVYTYGSERIRFFAAVNDAFFQSERSIEKLHRPLPFLRLLIP